MKNKGAKAATANGERAVARRNVHPPPGSTPNSSRLYQGVVTEEGAGARKRRQLKPTEIEEDHGDSEDEASNSEVESGESTSGSDFDGDGEENSGEEESGEESDEFEDQGSDSDDSEEMERQHAEAEASSGEDSDGSDGEAGVGGGDKGNRRLKVDESVRKTWSLADRSKEIEAAKGDGGLAMSLAMHTDDLSSDDDDENRNTVGRGKPDASTPRFSGA